MPRGIYDRSTAKPRGTKAQRKREAVAAKPKRTYSRRVSPALELAVQQTFNVPPPAIVQPDQITAILNPDFTVVARSELAELREAAGRWQRLASFMGVEPPSAMAQSSASE